MTGAKIAAQLDPAPAVGDRELGHGIDPDEAARFDDRHRRGKPDRDGIAAGSLLYGPDRLHGQELGRGEGVGTGELFRQTDRPADGEQAGADLQLQLPLLVGEIDPVALETQAGTRRGRSDGTGHLPGRTGCPGTQDEVLGEHLGSHLGVENHLEQEPSPLGFSRLSFDTVGHVFDGDRGCVEGETPLPAQHELGGAGNGRTDQGLVRRRGSQRGRRHEPQGVGVDPFVAAFQSRLELHRRGLEKEIDAVGRADGPAEDDRHVGVGLDLAVGFEFGHEHGLYPRLAGAGTEQADQQHGQDDSTRTGRGASAQGGDRCGTGVERDTEEVAGHGSVLL